VLHAVERGHHVKGALGSQAVGDGVTGVHLDAVGPMRAERCIAKAHIYPIAEVVDQNRPTNAERGTANGEKPDAAADITDSRVSPSLRCAAERQGKVERYARYVAELGGGERGRVLTCKGSKPRGNILRHISISTDAIRVRSVRGGELPLRCVVRTVRQSSRIVGGGSPPDLSQR
jgi:hypothetical protein